MFQINRNTKLGELPFPFKDLILEQAFCLPLTLSPLNLDDSLEDFAQSYELKWNHVESRLKKLSQAAVDLEQAVIEKDNAVILDCRAAASRKTNPIPNSRDISPQLMSELMPHKETLNILTLAETEKESYSAALYLKELGFDRVSIYKSN